MHVGDVICAKSIEHRIPVKVDEPKGEKRQRVLANRLGFKFQSEHNLISTVGVFIFLGTFPEVEDSEKVQRFAERQLKQLGWTIELPPAADAVDPHVADTGNPSTRDTKAPVGAGEE